MIQTIKDRNSLAKWLKIQNKFLPQAWLDPSIQITLSVTCLSPCFSFTYFCWLTSQALLFVLIMVLLAILYQFSNGINIKYLLPDSFKQLSMISKYYLYLICHMSYKKDQRKWSSSGQVWDSYTSYNEVC